MVLRYLRGFSAISSRKINWYSREATPGGNTFDADDCGGCIFVLADTVASSNFNSTSTQPDNTGRTALCRGNKTTFYTSQMVSHIFALLF